MVTYTKTELTQFLSNAYCECGGEFAAAGVAQTSMPPRYKHICKECTKEAYLDQNYPTIVYEKLPKV